MTFETPFGKRQNLIIKHRDNQIIMQQSMKVVSPIKDGDIPPFQLLEEFLNDEYRNNDRRGTKVDELFDIYKTEAKYIATEDFIIKDYPNSNLNRISDIVNFMDVRRWIASRITPPDKHKFMNKDTFGKDDIRTYDGGEYLDLAALVLCGTAIAPIIAALVLTCEYTSRDQAFVKSFEFAIEAIGIDLPIVQKYILHVTKIQRNKASVNLISNEGGSFDDNIAKLCLTTLFGRLATHNTLTDNNLKSLPTRLHQVILGKTEKSDKNAVKERSNRVAGKNVSGYDISTPYEFTGNIPEEYLWITEDPTVFIEQVYKDGLTEQQEMHYNMALDCVIGVPSPEVVGIMAIILRDFIAPEAIGLLGLKRPTANPKVKAIDVCRAAAYMEIVDDFPLIAKIIISKRNIIDTIVIGDNISQSKLKRTDLRHYTFTSTQAMTSLNLLADIVKVDYVCGLPEEYGGGPLILPISMRSDIVALCNMINDRREDNLRDQLLV